MSAKTFILATNSWEKLRKEIVKDYGMSTVLISWKLKETLGFTVREHTYVSSDSDGSWDRFTDIRLDFWDEPLQTMFLLKYSDFIDSQYDVLQH